MNDINPKASEHAEIREAVRAACTPFDSAYWQRVERGAGYPDDFVQALTAAGWLAALIPEEFGGGGLSLTEASVILEEINRSGANSGACHAQMYTMGTVLRHGSRAQKEQYLPAIASGQLRLQSFAVTEPATGTDTTRTRTMAVRRGDRIWARSSISVVKMKRLSDIELNGYLASMEWQGKAGGYAIQGAAGAFIPWISGSFTGIVGLPLAETAALLAAAGYPIWRQP